MSVNNGESIGVIELATILEPYEWSKTNHLTAPGRQIKPLQAQGF